MTMKQWVETGELTPTLLLGFTHAILVEASQIIEHFYSQYCWNARVIAQQLAHDAGILDHE